MSEGEGSAAALPSVADGELEESDRASLLAGCLALHEEVAVDYHWPFSASQLRQALRLCGLA